MAPRKANKTAKPAKKSITKDSNKVVKRPARGYHKYKNGLLNVTPKGSEIHLVQGNQNSPLLRLPPEIRNSIWGYALGNSVFRVHSSKMGRKKRLLPDEPGNSMSILRSCRQIYSETALMPFQLNTLAYSAFGWIRDDIKLLKRHQAKQITTVRLDACHPDDFCCEDPEWTHETLADIFPALKHIEVFIFDSVSPENEATLEEIRQHYRLALANTSVTMTVRGLDQHMPNLYWGGRYHSSV